MLTAIVTLPLAFVLGAALTAIYLPLARGQRWLDVPNHRSAHSERTPSSGGIAVVLALCLTLGLAAPRPLMCDTHFTTMVALLILLCLTGTWDDRSALPVTLRMALFAAVAVVAVGLYLPYGDAPSLALLVVAAVAFLWLLNLYNFMDGIDGLAALQCVLVAACLAFLAHRGGADASYLALALGTAGVFAGFLLFNWPRAKLFMGDAGSLCAGFLLGWLGLWGAMENWVPVTSWLILMSPFLVDTGFTLLRRARRGEALTQAHNEHLYQRLARHWASHRRVDCALVALQLGWLIPLAAAHALAGLSAGLTLVLALGLQGLAVAKTATLQ